MSHVTLAQGAGSKVSGAVSLNFVHMGDCFVSSQHWDEPEVAAGHPVTATTKGQGVADQDGGTGRDASIVTCAWSGASAPYTVTASLRVTPATSNRYFTLAAPVGAGTTAIGQVRVSARNLPETYQGDCMVTGIQVNAAKHSVWGSFSCDSFDSTGDVNSCKLGPSYFFFDNCTGP